MSPKITLSMQIEEACREIGKRKQVYPNLVARGKMRQAEADHAMERMEAIVRTLKWFQHHQQVIVDAVRASEEHS